MSLRFVVNVESLPGRSEIGHPPEYADPHDLSIGIGYCRVSLLGTASSRQCDCSTSQDNFSAIAAHSLLGRQVWGEYLQTLFRRFNGLFTPGDLRMQVEVIVLWALQPAPQPCASRM